MFVSKGKGLITMWFGGNAGLFLIKFAMITLSLPFVVFGLCYVFSGFDIDEAWYYFAKHKDRYGITIYFLSLVAYGAIVFGVVFIAMLMIMSILMVRIILI